MRRRAFLAGGAAVALSACSSGGAGSPAVAVSVSAPPAPAPIPRIDLTPLLARRDAAQAAAEARVAAARALPFWIPAGTDKAALAAGLAAGVPVNGMGLTYDVDGVLDLPPGAVLYDATLRQLSPQAPDVCTLRALGGAITLSNVTIDRGGDGTGGSQAEAAQALFQDCDLAVVDLAVIGSTAGAGVKPIRCTGALVRPRVTGNTVVASAEPADDLQDGIWVNQCVGLAIVSPVVQDLLTDWGQGPQPCFSRGITFAGGQGCLVSDYAGSNVDQHIDITGDENPTGHIILGGVADTGRNFGVKVAVSASGIRVLNVTAWRIARDAFYAEGGDATITPANATHDVIFQGCVADQTGFNRDAYGLTQSCGLKIEAGAAPNTGSPSGVQVLDCIQQNPVAVEYGFLDQVGGNVRDGCASAGTTIADFSGF